MLIRGIKWLRNDDLLGLGVIVVPISVHEAPLAIPKRYILSILHTAKSHGRYKVFSLFRLRSAVQPEP